MTSDARVVTINAALATDIGLKRKLNEDSGIAQMPIFAVADGMGGHDSGEVASAMVIDELSKLIDPDNPAPTTTKAVIEALNKAQERVSALSSTRPHGAGSTVSGIALVMRQNVPHWLVFNVGDSRVYRSLGDSLAQWTRDHSVIQLWVDQGIITPLEALSSTRSHEITRAVGATGSKPDFFFAPVVNGERLLICSDGLYSMMSSESIRASLVMSGAPKTTTESLVERAILGGGADNITAIVVDVISGGIAAGSDSESAIVDQSMDAMARAQEEFGETSTMHAPRPNAVPNFDEIGLNDDTAPLLAGTGVPSIHTPEDFDDDTEDTGPTTHSRIASSTSSSSLIFTTMDQDSEEIRIAGAVVNNAQFVAPAADDAEDTNIVTESDIDDSTVVVDGGEDTVLVKDDVDDETHVVRDDIDDETHVVRDDVDDETHVVRDDIDDETHVVNKDADEDTALVDDIDDDTALVTNDVDEETVAVSTSFKASPISTIEADEETPHLDDDEPIDVITPVNLHPAPNTPRSFIYDIEDADTNTGF